MGSATKPDRNYLHLFVPHQNPLSGRISNSKLYPPDTVCIVHGMYRLSAMVHGTVAYMSKSK